MLPPRDERRAPTWGTVAAAAKQAAAGWGRRRRGLPRRLRTSLPRPCATPPRRAPPTRCQERRGHEQVRKPPEPPPCGSRDHERVSAVRRLRPLRRRSSRRLENERRDLATTGRRRLARATAGVHHDPSVV